MHSIRSCAEEHRDDLNNREPHGNEVQFPSACGAAEAILHARVRQRRETRHGQEPTTTTTTNKAIDVQHATTGCNVDAEGGSVER
jgi:hypothetical protein